jgi:hypothetical protein
MPAEVGARAPDPGVPAGEQRVVDLDARGLQLRAGGGEEKVGARQTPRGVKREAGRGIQSSASGA